MTIEIKVPNVGESVQEGMIQAWRVASGATIKRDEVLLDLETDKATVEIVAEATGTVEILKKAGETVQVGEVIGRIKPGSASEATSAPPSSPSPPASSKPESKPSKPEPAPESSHPLSPAVRRIVDENKLDPSQIKGTGKDGRLTKADVISQGPSPAASPSVTVATKSPSFAVTPSGGKRVERREPMSMLRRRVAERLIQAQETAAILTTFNEIDMSAINELRAKYKESFKEKYGYSLGFMGMFVKASIEALKAFPQINGWIEGNEIVYHDYYDIGIAVSSNRGLVVPVVRDADRYSLPELEGMINNYAKKARDGKITVDDLTGGTFTVSNGGVFGSLLSTPILNPPQSGILGMHKTQDRPVAIDGQVVIRPMMFVALSYDHRIVDGREAVQFLVKVKECIEDPTRLLVGV